MTPLAIVIGSWVLVVVIAIALALRQSKRDQVKEGMFFATSDDHGEAYRDVSEDKTDAVVYDFSKSWRGRYLP